jgi:2-methylcitrate dehydratase PrpD
VKVDYDADINSMYPEKTASRVEIVTNGGETLTKQVEIPKGDPRDPMEEPDLAAKIKRFAGKRDEAKLDEVIGLVMELEKLSDVVKLSGLI